MQKFKTCSRRSLPFRLLVILAGAFLLLAVFAPRANADCPDCIRFYDMEAPVGSYGVGQGSHPPAIQQGEGFGPGLFGFALQNNDGTPYSTMNVSGEVGNPIGSLNLPVGADPNSLSLGIHRSGTANMNLVMNFDSAEGVYDIQSVSFASRGSGNGYQNVQLQMSIDGGANWTNLSVNTPIPTSDGVITLTNTLGVTLGNPSLLVRLHFTNGQSNGTNLQNVLDNFQVNGVIVPEPATVVGGLLGVLGLGWQQRRRLIRSVRFRRT